jgi:thiamine monophosphate kinase
MRRLTVTSTTLALAIAASALGSAQQGARDGEWRWHSGDLGSTKRGLHLARHGTEVAFAGVERYVDSPGTILPGDLVRDGVDHNIRDTNQRHHRTR